jgi:hypothetical protein
MAVTRRDQRDGAEAVSPERRPRESGALQRCNQQTKYPPAAQRERETDRETETE